MPTETFRSVSSSGFTCPIEAWQDQLVLGHHDGSPATLLGDFVKKLGCQFSLENAKSQGESRISKRSREENRLVSAGVMEDASLLT